ncbi:unnamed protein product [Ixodes pacificus]
MPVVANDPRAFAWNNFMVKRISSLLMGNLLCLDPAKYWFLLLSYLFHILQASLGPGQVCTQHK